MVILETGRDIASTPVTKFNDIELIFSDATNRELTSATDNQQKWKEVLTFQGNLWNVQITLLLVHRNERFVLFMATECTQVTAKTVSFVSNVILKKHLYFTLIARKKPVH